MNDADLCRSITSNPDLAIKHCTAAIEGRKASNEMLAQWYVLRGVQWADKGDYERAIADHTAALKLDPTVRHANYYRGSAWSHKGEFDHAIADFDAAAKLSADDPVVYHARGVELTVKGDYLRAIADFEKALQLDAKAGGVHFARGRTLFYMSEFARASGDFEAAFKAQPNVYTALWLFLARKRSGNHDADDLLERETRGIRAGWPAPLIALYMGRTGEFVWVLRRLYDFQPSDAATAIRALLAAANVEMNRPAVEAGLSMLDAGGDFADGVIAYEGN